MLQIRSESLDEDLGFPGLPPCMTARDAADGIAASRVSTSSATGRHELTCVGVKYLRRDLTRAWRAVEVLDLQLALNIARGVELALAFAAEREANQLRGISQVLKACAYTLAQIRLRPLKRHHWHSAGLSTRRYWVWHV